MEYEQMSLLGEEYESKESNDWKWSFKDYPPSKGINVFSCFSCGGGSTMGYKLAGCNVIGDLEIDPKINKIYVENHKPKYNYLMDIREFNNMKDLPEELYHLDILDGSPPCTTFSMAGDREDSWGKKKKFREGQVEQTLDDLIFVFIETVNKLKPKIAIMENVAGLAMGNAWDYVQRIYMEFNKIGYNIGHYLLKAEQMGIPQKRNRIFFIAVRKDIKFDFNDLDMSFDYKKVTYGMIKDGYGIQTNKKTKEYKAVCDVKYGEKDLASAYIRLFGKRALFNYKIIYDNDILPTICARKPIIYRYDNKTLINEKDVIHASTFPEDFNFINNTINNIGYICGMSVPPVMMKRIVNRLIESGVFKNGIIS